MRVLNDIPLGCPLLLPVDTVNSVQTLKANECPTTLPIEDRGPCGGNFYACQLAALVKHWRSTFVNSPANAPFLINELGGLQDEQWYGDHFSTGFCT
jgi:hypothetical protein